MVLQPEKSQALILPQPNPENTVGLRVEQTQNNEYLPQALLRDVAKNLNVQRAQVWSSDSIKLHAVKFVAFHAQILGNDGSGLKQQKALM